jgi:putative transcriptional regulator
MKRGLMDDVCVLLLRHGYTLKSLTRNSFDLIARKDSQVLLIKVLADANGISEENAVSMKNLSSYIDAAPIIVSEKAGTLLENGVVYSRFGVYVFNNNTFRNCLENSFPIVVSTKAGFAAAVIGERLRQKREEEGYSLGTVSQKIGVSKRMITKYESNKADISLRGAIALNKLLGDSIFRKIDVFAVAKEISNDHPSEIAKKYYELGFRAADTKKTPFDVVARLEKELILTDVNNNPGRPNIHLQSMQQLLGADALIIFDHEKAKDKKMPSLQKKDFLDLKSANELLRFLDEFNGG